MTRAPRLLSVALAVVAISAVAHGEEATRERKALVRQGARQWGAACGTCHNARPAAERTPAEWDTLMLHMRVRANLPAEDARALLEYLKAR